MLAYALPFVISLVIIKLLHSFISPSWRTLLPPVMQNVRKKGTAPAAPWVQYAQAAKAQGPLLTVSSVGKPVIILNDRKTITDLMQNSASGSLDDKPRWPMAELLGRHEDVAFAHAGEWHRTTRTFLGASLGPSSVQKRWAHLLDDQSRRLMRVFGDFQSPTFFYEAIQSNSQQLLVRLAYGREPDAAYLRLAQKVKSDTAAAMVPGRWKVNQFPILMWVPAWFPGASFQRWAKEAKASFREMARRPFEKVEEAMKSGNAEPSFVRDALESLVPDSRTREYDRGVIMSSANSLFAAGSDTIASTLLTFLALILRHPEVQETAYREIISALGTARLPAWSDAPALPYVDALIREVHRVNPAVPLVSRASNVEERVAGFQVPGGTWVVGNIWASLHDVKEYSEPEKFNPARFIPSKHRPAEKDPRTLVFGFGGRVCPGRHLANAYIFLVITRAIFLFEIVPEGERTALGPLEFRIALVPAPKPFACVFEPREHAGNFLE